MPLTSYLAQGDISPSRFVMQSDGDDFGVVQGTANAVLRGVAQEGSASAPIPGASNLAAVEGQSLHVYGDAQECLLEAGASISAGDYLSSDADGKAQSINTAAPILQNYGAVALEAGESGELIRVQVLLGAHYPTLS